MSDIQDHVVSKDVAEKLKGYLPKGFKSYDFWYYDNRKKEWLLARGDIILRCLCGTPLDAPILEEMLEIMPETVYVKQCKKQEDKFGNCECSVFGKNFHLKLSKEDGGYTVYYICAQSYVIIEGVGSMSQFDSPNPADAAALLFIWMVDNKHIEVKK